VSALAETGAVEGADQIGEEHERALQQPGHQELAGDRGDDLAGQLVDPARDRRFVEQRGDRGHAGAACRAVAPAGPAASRSRSMPAAAKRSRRCAGGGATASIDGLPG